MRYDWASLEAEYIQTKISYQKLAEKYNLSASNIEKYGAKNKWKDKRKKYCENIVEKSNNKAANAAAKKIAKLARSADKMNTVINRIFKDSEQFNRYIVNDDFVTTEKVFKKADTKAIRDLVSTMKDLSCVLRDLYDFPTSREIEERRIALERLKLETAKANQPTQDENIEIVIGDERAKDWFG